MTTLLHVAAYLIAFAAFLTILLWRLQKNAETAMDDGDELDEPAPCNEGIMEEIEL